MKGRLLRLAAWLLIVSPAAFACSTGADTGSGSDAGPVDAAGASDTSRGDVASLPEVDAPEPTADASADASDAVDPAAEALTAWCGAGSAAIETRIDSTLQALTLEQKASLMHGSVALTNGTWETPAIPEQDIPGFHMLDGPRGLSRMSKRTGTAFPVAMARGATWDAELERRVGAMIGAELRLIGADVLLAPTVNILRHPRWGRAQETYGEDPFQMGVLGAAFVEGVQEHVMAVVKHYAANSIEDTRLEVDVHLAERTLREVYLPHFRRIVRDAKVAGVMTAYNQVNGAWASESVPLIREILHDDWGFAGFTVSDFIWGTHDPVKALTAGLDVEMPLPNVYGDPVTEAVTAGDVDVALVDAAVRRILRSQWCFRELTTAPEITETESSEALALAREAARKGMVLLRNDDAALPIDRGGLPTIVVVGSLAEAENTGDRGSSHVDSTDVVTMLEGLQQAAGEATVVHIPGELTTQADQDAVAAADVVVAVVGYSEDEEGEGQIAAGDRESLALPDDDIAVLSAVAALNDRVVAVVVGGSSFTLDGWADGPEAIVVAWYAGAQGGHALADLLYGAANFQGRLPITFAARDADHPAFDNQSLRVDYGYFHGYRHLQNEAVAPLFPFGFGLAYTDFAYGSLEVARDDGALMVKVAVRNAGDVAGVETVQVYVSAPGQAVEMAPRDLRGFAQVALDAGETRAVEVRIPTDELRYWDEARRSWQLEPGDHLIQVGPNVATLPLSASVSLP